MLHLPLWFGSNPLVDSRDRAKGRKGWPSMGRARAVVPVPGRPSARRGLARCSSCSLRVLERLSFNLFCQVFLVGRCWPDHPSGVAGLSVRHGLSAVLARTVRISLGAFWRFELVSRTVRPWTADYLLHPCGLSARALRTVRPELHRLPKSLSSCVVLPLWIGLGLVPRVGRFVVTSDLGKLVWEFVVVILGHNRVHLFGEDFLSVPIHYRPAPSLVT
jgi:hypothetical protein